MQWIAFFHFVCAFAAIILTIQVAALLGQAPRTYGTLAARTFDGIEREISTVGALQLSDEFVRTGVEESQLVVKFIQI